jgi:hopene-associated glycosyltransferase HpnB
MSFAAAVGAVATLVWLYLLLARGGFWLARERDDERPFPPPGQWPSVVAVVPARNEAEVIGQSMESLLRQDYPGSFRIVLVDDNSDDGTGATAMRLTEDQRHQGRLDIVSGSRLPEGWTGKLWAMQQGVQRALAGDEKPDYFLLTDADIGHTPDNLRALVARAERERLVLVSLMAELTCTTWAERTLIPAFVFFFQMLYPFSWVAQKRRKLAAAAGGCMLVKRDAFERAGGIAAIRAELIDDCALARRLKQQGAIWLGLTRRARSLRPYGGFLQIGRMISRSAYTQLRYSPLLLAGTVVGMLILCVAPPVLALFASGAARWSGLCVWLLQALAFQPMLRFYRLSSLWGIALPLIGSAYLLFTVQSALETWRGRGGMWKGRAQAGPS